MTKRIPSAFAPAALAAGALLALWAAFPGSAASQAPAAAPQPAPAAASGDDAAALTRKICSNCHEIGVVTGQRKTRDEWNITMDKMIQHGAPVTDEQADAIVDYLAKTYPSN